MTNFKSGYQMSPSKFEPSTRRRTFPPHCFPFYLSLDAIIFSFWQNRFSGPPPRERILSREVTAVYSANSSNCEAKCFLWGTNWIFTCLCQFCAAGIATGYRLDGRGVGVPVPVGSRISLFSTSSRSALGPTQPPIQWLPGGKVAEAWSWPLTSN
jgi:hypothetical protein